MKTKIAFPFILLITGCTGLKNYNNDGCQKILSEKATLTIAAEQKAISKGNKQSAALAIAAGSILPPIIEGVSKVVQQAAKKDVAAYKGEYRCSGSGDKFYLTNQLVSLPKLTIIRKIKKSDKTDVTAVSVVLVPELSTDQTAFRYSVKDNFIYDYSIAKTKKNYDFIDVNIEIKFKSISVAKGEYKVSELRTTTIFVPMVEVGKTTSLSDPIYSGWIPLPPRSNAKAIKDVTSKDEKTTTKKVNAGNGEKTVETTETIKKDSEEYEDLPDNTGQYEIEITVTETNPYKIKAENRQELIENTSESGEGILKAIIKTVTKEDDKKEDKE